MFPTGRLYKYLINYYYCIDCHVYETALFASLIISPYISRWKYQCGREEYVRISFMYKIMKEKPRSTLEHFNTELDTALYILDLCPLVIRKKCFQGSDQLEWYLEYKDMCSYYVYTYINIIYLACDSNAS